VRWKDLGVVVVKGRMQALRPPGWDGDQVVDPPEAGLIARAREGDARAFTALVRSHDDDMRGLAYSLLGSRTAMDDALQDAYVKAYRAIGSFRGGAQFGTWLHRIVRNTCVDHLRRSNRRREVSLELIVSNPDPDVGAEERFAERSRIGTALAVLSHEQRCVVVLVDREGCSYEEAAQLLGISPGTVASRLSRARSTLRAALGANPQEGTR
jgi:RNA polymerase sigma-70 factor (ECF subfamily)